MSLFDEIIFDNDDSGVVFQTKDFLASMDRYRVDLCGNLHIWSDGSICAEEGETPEWERSDWTGEVYYYRSGEHGWCIFHDGRLISRSPLVPWDEELPESQRSIPRLYRRELALRAALEFIKARGHEGYCGMTERPNCNCGYAKVVTQIEEALK